MKVYISLPMSGHEHTVWDRWVAAKENVNNLFSNNVTITGPSNIDEFDSDGEKIPHDRDWCYYMARDVEDLLRSDAIYLTKGWKNSKGCRVEYAIASEMGHSILFAPDAHESL